MGDDSSNGRRDGDWREVSFEGEEGGLGRGEEGRGEICEAEERKEVSWSRDCLEGWTMRADR